MPSPDLIRTRPRGVLVAAVGGAVVGLLLTVLGVISLFSGHGGFSGGVGVALALYGLLIVAAAVGLWQGWVFARGPLIATGIINLIVAFTMAGSAPEAWAVAVVSAVTVVAAALPSTAAALHWRREVTPADGPPPTDAPGS